MIDVEVFGAELLPSELSPAEVSELCVRTTTRVGIEDAHVAVEFVEAVRIERLNAEHRARPEPTDVLSFPIDGVEPFPHDGAPRELGDIVICPEHTSDLREAVVHGMLHLLGMDHETDDGEMLRLQRELLPRASR
ncbi:MAG TPA: rRNA maturation RNase YbeY [Solirubrobacteraceae bacterium]|nr:rRNA maturation RNase YbeY [Solirubrobacteraceae bacterium]